MSNITQFDVYAHGEIEYSHQWFEILAAWCNLNWGNKKYTWRKDQASKTDRRKHLRLDTLAIVIFIVVFFCKLKWNLSAIWLYIYFRNINMTDNTSLSAYLISFLVVSQPHFVSTYIFNIYAKQNAEYNFISCFSREIL